MGIKIILQNAKAQLEAQKTKAYNDAKNQMLARSKADYDAFAAQKKSEYDEAVKALNEAYNNALTERKSADERTACEYAESYVGEINNSINQLQEIIDKTAEI